MEIQNKEDKLLEEFNNLSKQIKVLENRKSEIWNKLMNEHGLNRGQIIYKLGRKAGLK